jgi:hypothetical protein
MEVLFLTQNIKTKEKCAKISKILGEKYKHSQRHLEYLIFQDWQQIFYNRSISRRTPKFKTFYPAVPLPKNHEFFAKDL